MIFCVNGLGVNCLGLFSIKVDADVFDCLGFPNVCRCLGRWPDGVVKGMLSMVALLD
jgi:hypothetical protein